MKANIGRKAAEQRELQKWNPNAQGRSQGLVHILDYAYARPPMRPEEHPQAEEISRGQPMSGRKFMERLGIKDEKAFAKFAATNLEEYRSENEDLGKPLLPVAEKNGDGKIKFTNPQEQQQELQGLEAQMRDMMKDLEPVEKKQVGQSEAYRDLAQRKKALEASLLLSKGYRVKRDESKRGRIAQVEKAIGKAPGEFKSGEGEITGVTRALDLLTGETKPASVQGPTGQPMTLAKEWVRSKKADQPPRWTEKENVEITDTAQGEEYQTAGTADRPNLEIRKWGPHPKAVRYSTVHGAHGKK
jgi:hypothetical protein